MNAALIEKKWSFPAFCLLIAGLILVKSIFLGEYGRIGPDSDDAMRLAQIRDFLTGGQSWFDTNQYRMGVNGTDMHWSRLADIPLIILIGLFDIFLPYTTAENLAISIWPPLSAIVVLVGVFTGARFLKNQEAAWLATLLSALYLLTHYRFSAGAIDHHNIQFGLISMAVGFALDPKYRAKSFAISGICTALSVAIGTEVYLFDAVICGFIAALWLFRGNSAQNGVTSFGLSLAATLICTFILVTNPAAYGTLYCDSLSWITIAAGALGGLGLAIVSQTLSGRSFPIRLSGIGVLGVTSLGLLLTQAPQCLSNPLDDLPSDMKTLWLDNIVEARPLFSATDALLIGPLGIGVTLTAFILAVMKITKGEHRPQYGLLTTMFLVGTMLSLYQMRFVGFGQFLSFMVTGIWIYELLQKTNDKGERSLAYLGGVALSIPMFWAVPGVVLGQANKGEAETRAAIRAELCFSETVIAYMQTLPTGRILATDNGTPIFLTQTDHGTLGGNYHRNVDGVQLAINAYTTEPVKAMSYLADGAVDYVHVCRTTQETIVLKDHNPEGLISALFDSTSPAFLSELETLEDGAVTIYQFNPR